MQKYEYAEIKDKEEINYRALYRHQHRYCDLYIQKIVMCSEVKIPLYEVILKFLSLELTFI